MLFCPALLHPLLCPSIPSCSILCPVLNPPPQVKEAKAVYGVTTLEHPAVQMISMERGKYYLGGKVQGLEVPKR